MYSPFLGHISTPSTEAVHTMSDGDPSSWKPPPEAALFTKCSQQYICKRCGLVRPRPGTGAGSSPGD
jgi:hypothetical protein